MPRRPRIDFAGARHHVFNRGARRQPIFALPADVALLYDLLRELPDRYGLRIHGYALMPNHLHLMVESSGRLPAAMKRLFGGYASALNARYDWDGPLWKGRYQNRLVFDEEYWRHLLAYLHLNPVRAGLARTASAASETSHAAYAGLGPTPDWLTTGDLLAAFGGRTQLSEYTSAVRLKHQASPKVFEPDSLWTSTQAAPPRPRNLDRDSALRRLEQRFGVPIDELRRARPGPNGDRRRWVAAWWLTRHAGLSNKEAARLLHANPTSLPRWIRRVTEDDSGELSRLRWRLDLEG
jgi:REP element-mobilizing transposase RayT